MKAWHFARNDLRLGHGDGRLIVVGETVTVDPDRLQLCHYGLHASVKIMDALRLGRGFNICRVEMGGKILTGDDKVCASERTVLWYVAGEQILRDFARWSARQVLHLWKVPDVVREFLETGNEEIRAAASDAAWDASDAASDAARDAAWAAQGTELERLVVEAHEREAVHAG